MKSMVYGISKNQVKRVYFYISLRFIVISINACHDRNPVLSQPTSIQIHTHFFLQDQLYNCPAMYGMFSQVTTDTLYVFLSYPCYPRLRDRDPSPYKTVFFYILIELYGRTLRMKFCPSFHHVYNFDFLLFIPSN
jgi:hypothetical protein